MISNDEFESLKNKYICTAPFDYIEIYDDKTTLCCPAWIDSDTHNPKSILDGFRSDVSKRVRESILDGSYKYCSDTLCPFLKDMKENGNIRTESFLEKNEDTLKYFIIDKQFPSVVNFCFDRSCNYQCPSCRNEFINYLGADRNSVDLKLQEVNTEISPYIKHINLSGTADPFYSKSFRQFLRNINPKNYPKLENIHLHTNGSLWDGRMWDSMKSIHPYVKTCEISIDAGTKDTYENKTRIGGNWESILERISFISTINTIERFRFSFVVQDTNYKEMKLFYDIISNIFNHRQNINLEIYYGRIVNWNTFTNLEFVNKDVCESSHPNYSEYLYEVLKLKNLPNIMGNIPNLINEK